MVVCWGIVFKKIPPAFVNFKFSESKMLGSGVVIEITALGDWLKIDPFFLANGLSEETIKCLQADLKRSVEYMTEFKPK